MNTSYLRIITTLLFLVIASCNKKQSETAISSKKGNVGFDNRDVTSLPLKIYIDNKHVGSIGNPMPVYRDCGNFYVHMLFEQDAGSHTFALVNSYGQYTDGIFTVTSNNCLAIPFYASNFGKVNYGTNNGSLTIISSILNANLISVYVDNNYMGTISHAAGFYRCGYPETNYVISLPLAPGLHSYRAVEAGTGKTWTGTKNIEANICTATSLQP